jgi:hypothetical protein
MAIFVCSFLVLTGLADGLALKELRYSAPAWVAGSWIRPN